MQAVTALLATLPSALAAAARKCIESRAKQKRWTWTASARHCASATAQTTITPRPAARVALLALAGCLTAGMITASPFAGARHPPYARKERTALRAAEELLAGFARERGPLPAGPRTPGNPQLPAPGESLAGRLPTRPRRVQRRKASFTSSPGPEG